MTCAQGLLRLLWGRARSWSATGLYRITSNTEQLERGRRTLVNIAIDVQNFSKMNETCENTLSLLSVSEK